MPEQAEEEDLAVSQRHAGAGEGAGEGEHPGQYLQRRLHQDAKDSGQQ